MFGAYWWVIIPLGMMVFCIFMCVFMMRGRGGSMMCGFGPQRDDGRTAHRMESAKDILDKRFARGEIDQAEYEEKKSNLVEK